MSYQIIQGDAADLPLPDDSVDLIVTSPPYFGLRSYKDGGEHMVGQVGAEATPAEFVDALVACTREWVRVLKPSGSLWVNLGDKYNSKSHWATKDGLASNAFKDGRRGASSQAFPTKSLIGVPWRYALACIDDLGLILRAEVIWSKNNGLPESVRDRVRRSHETWFHFTLQPRYFSSVDEIREAHEPAGLARRAYAFAVNDAQRAGANPVLNGAGMRPANPLGKLPGSVWTIPTQPLRVPPELGIDHFAAFPMEWPRRIIRGWAPTRGICTVCGEGLRAVTQVSRAGDCTERRDSDRGYVGAAQGQNRNAGQFTITGYTCACGTPGETRPAIVLDPFGGTGTTALLADVLGCHGISVDLSADYCRLAEWRCADPKQRERAAKGNTPKRKKAA